jgi:FtsP/CotA-like multicopper oxidase with cupredoxin domain
MTVVQADGHYVEPVTVGEFRIGIAETYDAIVQPADNASYTIFAQSEDRSGFAPGTLAPRDYTGDLNRRKRAWRLECFWNHAESLTHKWNTSHMAVKPASRTGEQRHRRPR